MRPEKGYFCIPSQIKKKITKIHVDRGPIFYSKKFDKVIKISWKDVILAPLHASFDHRMCAHARKSLASVWPSDKSGKILKKSLKLSDQM